MDAMNGDGQLSTHYFVIESRQLQQLAMASGGKSSQVKFLIPIIQRATGACKQKTV
jgi:hypothetical protein